VIINDNDEKRLESARAEFQKQYGKDVFIGELLDVTQAADIRKVYRAAALLSAVWILS